MPRAKVNITEKLSSHFRHRNLFRRTKRVSTGRLFPISGKPARKIGSSFLPYSSVCIYNHVAERSLSDEREVLNNLCSDSE